jgi:hypothetical protein
MSGAAFRALSLPAAALLLLATATPGSAGVKYGDAVPAIITASDLTLIKRALDLDHFSVVAAVRLGAEEGREALVAEPLDKETLKLVEKACEAGGFCPDPLGFLASRVRIVLLQGSAVEVLLTADAQVRNQAGPLFEPKQKGIDRPIVAWNGRANEGSSHVAVDLLPVTRLEKGAGADGGSAAPPGDETPGDVGLVTEAPFSIRWNDKAGRFQLYDCSRDERGRRQCGFESET